MNCKGVFSKQSDLWKTPSNIYKRFMEDGYFDPCPTNPTFDGLSIPWKKKNFVNPPYSQIMKWLDKAFAERERESNLCIRKLTPKECCLLTGFDSEDYNSLVKAGLSDSAIFHVCGDGLITTIFGSLINNMYRELNSHEKIINDYVEKEIL